MINTNKALLALTSLSEQAMHAHIAIRLSRENDQIFSVIPVINSALNSAIMDESCFSDGGMRVSLALGAFVDGDLIGNYLKNCFGITDVVVQRSGYLNIIVISFKIIAAKRG